MAGGVDVKMGISGASQFKNDINKIRTSLKTLDESLKLTEKEYQKTGDAEAYMQTKAELLQTKLEAQKHIAQDAEQALANMASQGVDKASKAFQDMQRQLIQAKGDIIDTEAQLQNVNSTSSEAASNVDGMNQQLKRIGDGVNFQNVTQGIEKITDGLKKAATKALDLGKKIVTATLDAGHWADEIMTEAKVYGVTPEDLQRMQYTARKIDTDVDTIITARNKLKKARAGESKETMGAFAALGIDPATAKDAEDLFWKTGESLMKLGDEYRQEDYAQKLFGKGWHELIPLFEAGREEYEKTNASWNVVSQDQLENLGKMDDEFQTLQANWETLKIDLLSTLAGPLTKGMEKLNELLGKATAYLQSEEGQEMVDNVVSAITTSLEWITEHSGEVITALGGIAAAFAALKLGEVAMNIGRVVSGFRGLFGGGGGDAGGTPAIQTAGSSAASGLLYNLPALTTIATKSAEKLIETGASAALPFFGDWAIHNTGFGQEYMGTKEKGSTIKEIKQNVKEYAETLTAVAKNNYEYWFGGKGIFAQQKEASDWILGDDASIEDSMAFVQDQSRMNDAIERNNRRLDSLHKLDELTSSLDRMTQVTEENNKSTKESERNSLTPSDLTEFKGLPADIAAAIQKVKLNVNIDGPGLITYINAHTGSMLAGDNP